MCADLLAYHHLFIIVCHCLHNTTYNYDWCDRTSRENLYSTKVHLLATREIDSCSGHLIMFILLFFSSRLLHH